MGAEALKAGVVSRTAGAEVSYLDAGPSAIGAKVREEADQLARALAGDSEERVANEAADLVYNLLVALRARDVSWRDVLKEDLLGGWRAALKTA